MHLIENSCELVVVFQRKLPHETIYIDIKDAAAGW